MTNRLEEIPLSTSSALCFKNQSESSGCVTFVPITNNGSATFLHIDESLMLMLMLTLLMLLLPADCRRSVTDWSTTFEFIGASSELSIARSRSDSRQQILAGNSKSFEIFGYFFRIILQTDGFQMKMKKMKMPRTMLRPPITLRTTFNGNKHISS